MKKRPKARPMAAAILVSALLCACASVPAIHSGSASIFEPEPEPATGYACPSADFPVFLRHFADPSSDDVRRRFTADPLQYEVPTHTVRDETASSPATLVIPKAGPTRLDLFPYRFVGNDEAFARVEIGMASAAGALYPISVETLETGQRRVAFGMEYDVDTYRFERRADCWYLTRAINLRD